MNTHTYKTQDNKSQSVANAVSHKQSGGKPTFQFVDDRPEAAAQRKLQETANNSPQVAQLRAFQEMTNNSLNAKQAAQLRAMVDNYYAQQSQPIMKKENKSGLPDNLKFGIENLSGYSKDDKEVHYNSEKPTQLQAHAYAQRTDIPVASGQKKHLFHEDRNMAQQKQRRVKPTLQMKGIVDDNDDEVLDKDADVMGAKPLQMTRCGQPEMHTMSLQLRKETASPFPVRSFPPSTIVQRAVPKNPGLPKPVAVTGSYKARGGKKTMYNKGKHIRSKFSFGSKTRAEVFKRYPHKKGLGNRIITVKDVGSGQMVNVEGIQLDHRTSWEDIATAMQNHNIKLFIEKKKAQKSGKKQPPDNLFYSLWDAKMYYNDITNLQPVLGALNAKAGAKGFRGVGARIHKGLQGMMGDIHVAWMNLQQGMSALGSELSWDAALEIGILLAKIRTAMNDTTERLL